MKSEGNFTERYLRQYWNQAAKKIQAYHNAPSTQLYLEQEKRLIEKYCFPLGGKFFLKTDLWNEAKNTQILRWLLTKKALIYAIDISNCIANQAWGCFEKDKPFITVADLRKLPFPDNFFDYIYSMGTAEHFANYETAFREIYRVLKRGGIAIIGVPNKFDPFFRPLFVFFLQRLRIYFFGYEKSFSKKEMIQILKKTHFKIKAQTSILFMPGILRFLDIFFFNHIRLLTNFSRILLAPFESLYNCSQFFQYHGYMLAFIVSK
jgi:SAM-dependent methyltransferase